MRARRAALGLSQAELAAAAGVDRRQIRRYEAGEQQPTLAVAVAIARALEISVGELADEPTHRVDLTGEWWAGWQAEREGEPVVSAQQVAIRQRGEAGYEIKRTTRAVDAAEGGYLWRGELRLWDNEILTGWYVADEGAGRAKGTLYFVLQPNGAHLRGRWVGIGSDGAIQTGWGALARTEREAQRLVESLVGGGGP
jgi:transcriptional regulator with XRE-family HTH domain